MISQTNNSAVLASYQAKSNDAKEAKQSTSVSAKTETNKIDELKAAIDSGSYKVDINALSEKIADSLL